MPPGRTVDAAFSASVELRVDARRVVVQNLGVLELAVRQHSAFAGRAFGALRRGCARLLSAGRAAEICPVYPAAANLRSEVVPFAPSGLAAGSLKALRPGAEQPSTRVLASAGDEDLLVVAVAPATSKVKVLQSRDGFELSTRSGRKRFSVGKSGAELLSLH